MNAGNVVLVVDDDPINLEILEKHLSAAGYLPELAGDGEIAWRMLQESPDKYDTVLLDRMMPNMNGMEVLKLMKADEKLSWIPVIMQTAKAAKSEVLEGLQAGAYYYVTKPFDKATLLAIVKTAVTDHTKYTRLRDLAKRTVGSFSLMKRGEYEFKTIEEADTLATLLAQTCPNPEKIATGLSELLLNAVEHGNLGLTYEEKTEFIDKNILLEELDRRLLLPENNIKRAVVGVERIDGHIIFHIADEGDGFDWDKYLEIDADRAFDNHGRGIAMSRAMSFQRVEYLGKGNELKAYVPI